MWGLILSVGSKLLGPVLGLLGGKRKTLILAGVIGVPALLGGAWLHGYSVSSAKAAEAAERARHEAVARALAQYKAMEKENRAIVEAWEERQREREVVYKTRTKEVIRYVEKRGTDPECFDARGLQLIRSAAHGN